MSQWRATVDIIGELVFTRGKHTIERYGPIIPRVEAEIDEVKQHYVAFEQAESQSQNLDNKDERALARARSSLELARERLHQLILRINKLVKFDELVGELQSLELETVSEFLQPLADEAVVAAKDQAAFETRNRARLHELSDAELTEHRVLKRYAGDLLSDLESVWSTFESIQLENKRSLESGDWHRSESIRDQLKEALDAALAALPDEFADQAGASGPYRESSHHTAMALRRELLAIALHIDLASQSEVKALLQKGERQGMLRRLFQRTKYSRKAFGLFLEKDRGVKRIWNGIGWAPPILLFVIGVLPEPLLFGGIMVLGCRELAPIAAGLICPEDDEARELRARDLMKRVQYERLALIGKAWRSAVAGLPENRLKVLIDILRQMPLPLSAAEHCDRLLMPADSDDALQPFG